MTAMCVQCTAPTSDAALLCRPDTEHLLGELYAVSAVVEDLEVTIARQDNHRGPGRAVGKSSETPLPWNDRASERLADLRTILITWAREVATRLHVAQLPVVPRTRNDLGDPTRIARPVDIATLASRLLAENIEDVRHLDVAGQIYDDVLEALRAARRAVDRPAERRYAGVCSAVLEDGTECSVDLYVLPRRATAFCPGCGAEHDVEQRRAILRQAMTEHLEWQVGTAAEVAGWLRLSGMQIGTSTVRRWAAEKRMTATGRNAMGHSLYRFGEVRMVLETLHNSKQGTANVS